MPRDATIIPAETAVLCEGCGYLLDGLPTTGLCPECGLPIARSLEQSGRSLPAWEDPADPAPGPARFARTTARILRTPTDFYRTLATRRHDRAALRFAQVHWALSAILFAGALSIHTHWYQTVLGAPRYAPPWLVGPVGAVATFFFLWGTTRLAGRLTAWEAAYRGLRLPIPVVLRGMYYHAAHYLPVAALAFATVATHYLLLRYRVLSVQDATKYLLVLCTQVILAATYLFHTYWTGMKNTMYANR